jgi:RNA polymerase sigma-70 factor (ECF subfamily)
LKGDALNNLDEELLVKYCKDNNSSAQKILYNKYVEQMMIVCLRYIVNSEDAKEALMDSFLSFFKNINGFTYQGEGSVKAWLKKIVVNRCLMHLRKRRSFFITGKEAEQYEHIDNGENVFDQLNAKEIMKMIHSLPDGYRTVFNLYFFEGKNHREISELLDISENTSKSQLHRARTILKEKILQAS